MRPLFALALAAAASAFKYNFVYNSDDSVTPNVVQSVHPLTEVRVGTLACHTAETTIHSPHSRARCTRTARVPLETARHTHPLLFRVGHPDSLRVGLLRLHLKPPSPTTAELQPNITEAVRFHVVIVDTSNSKQIGILNQDNSVVLCCSTALRVRNLCGDAKQTGDIIAQGATTDGSKGTPLVQSWGISAVSGTVTGSVKRVVTVAGEDGQRQSGSAACAANPPPRPAAGTQMIYLVACNPAESAATVPPLTVRVSAEFRNPYGFLPGQVWLAEGGGASTAAGRQHSPPSLLPAPRADLCRPPSLRGPHGGLRAARCGLCHRGHRAGEAAPGGG